MPMSGLAARLRRAAVLFPGQGTQFIGMAKSLCEQHKCARDIVCAVEDAIHFPLRTLMWEGPLEELAATSTAQPAILAHSLASWAVLRERAGEHVLPAAFAGHSVGEFAALVAAGSLALEDAAQLVRCRGIAMEQCVRAWRHASGAARHTGAFMVAVQRSTREACEAAAANEPPGTCALAADNTALQCVLSGDPVAVANAVSRVEAEGRRSRARVRVQPLRVSAPFHSPLLADAEDALRDALAATPLRSPATHVASNLDGALLGPHTGPEEIRERLARAVTRTVEWRACMAALRVDAAVECGPGTVLRGFAQRETDWEMFGLQEAGDVDALHAGLCESSSPA